MKRETPRKYWPLDTLKKVLLELIQEVPQRLLADYLVCTAAGSADWWQRQRTFTHSMAVSSAVRAL